MVGHGCEWRIDPLSGRAACLGCFVRSGMSNSRFGIGGNGKLYLAATSGWAYDTADVKIFERVGDVDYKLRSSFEYQGKDKDKKTLYWADENGDGRKQPNEVATIAGHVRFSAWYMNFAPDLTIYADDRQYKVAGFTPCGRRNTTCGIQRGCRPAAWARPMAVACWPSANTAYRKAGFTASTSPAAKSSGVIRTTSSACTARTRHARRRWA